MGKERNVINVEDFVDRLELLMRNRKWKVPQLAEAIGIPESSAYNIWKKPLKYHPRADIVLKIAQALDVSVEYLMTGQHPKVKQEAISPVKEELIEYIKSLDEESIAELKGMIKTLNMMSLKEASRKEQDRRHA